MRAVISVDKEANKRGQRAQSLAPLVGLFCEPLAWARLGASRVCLVELGGSDDCIRGGAVAIAQGKQVPTRPFFARDGLLRLGACRQRGIRRCQRCQTTELAGV